MRPLSHEQQSILDLCARVELVEARLGLRRHLDPCGSTELAHRLDLIEAKLRLQPPAPPLTYPPEFLSRRRA